MEGLERRWGGARGRRGRDRRPRFWWTVVVRRGCGVRSRAGSCVIGFPAVNIRCKPGMSSSEHVDRGGDLGGVPIPDGLVERGSAIEHSLHRRHLRRDPTTYLLVKYGSLHEHFTHVCDLGGVP